MYFKVNIMRVSYILYILLYKDFKEEIECFVLFSLQIYKYGSFLLLKLYSI